MLSNLLKKNVFQYEWDTQYKLYGLKLLFRPKIQKYWKNQILLGLLRIFTAVCLKSAIQFINVFCEVQCIIVICFITDGLDRDIKIYKTNILHSFYKYVKLHTFMTTEEDDVRYLFKVLTTFRRIWKCHQWFQHICQHKQRILCEKHSSEYNAKKAEIFLRNGGGRGRGIVELLFEIHDIKLWEKISINFLGLLIRN